MVFYPQRITERLDTRYTALLSLPGFHQVYLEDLAAHPAPTMGLQLLRLLVAEPEEAQQLAQRLVQQAQADPLALPMPFSDLLSLLETILVYRLSSLTHSEIQVMLGLTHVDLLRLLRRRFGVLPSVQEDRIRSLSLAQVEALAEALLDFQTPGELSAWLDGRANQI